jgi:hypothetical protein
VRAEQTLSGLPTSLPAAEADEWTRRLRQTARPCGCKSGAGLTLFALFGWPVWVIAAGLPHTATGLAAAVAVYGLVVIGSGAVGKIAGIAVGRFRHRLLRRRLAQRLAHLRALHGV